MTEVKSLPITSIVESKTNPRKHFNEGSLHELAKSIQSIGILDPILVRPSNGHFEIVTGHRRFRAAKIAKQPEVPVVIRELNDESALAIQVIENLLREDVHPLDEALGYEQLMKRNKWDVERISAEVSKSTSYVYQRLKLAELIEPAQKAFWDARLTASHAILIARLQPKDQERALAFALKSWHGFEGLHEYHNELNPDPSDEQRILKEHAPAQTVCSVRDLTDFIQERILLDLREAAFDKRDDKLIPKAGSCLACPKRSGFNKELFGDITKSPDICTDAVCFTAKQAAHVERLKVEFKKNKQKFIEVTADQRKPAGHPGAITERSFKKVSGKPCKHARIGIYIDGANKGETVTICASKKECKQHWAEYQKARQHHSGYAAPARIDYEAEQRKREEKKRRAWKRFRPIAELIWKNIPKTVPKQEVLIEQLAGLVAREIPYDLKDCKPKGLKLSAVQMINLGILCTQYAFDVTYEGEIKPGIFKAAKKLGIKFEPILQKIADEEKAEAKAEKDKAPAKVQTSAKAKKPAKKKAGKKKQRK